MQVALGKMHVDRGVLDVGMSQQQLNGMQVSAGFQQMGCIGVPQTVGADFFWDAGPLRGAVAGVPHGLGSQWHIGAALAGLTGKQVAFRLGHRQYSRNVSSSFGLGGTSRSLLPLP